MARAIGKILIVKPIIDNQEVNGLITSTTSAEFPDKGLVLSVGDAVDWIKEGDTIIFRKGMGTGISLNGEDVLLIDEKSIYCIL